MVGVLRPAISAVIGRSPMGVASVDVTSLALLTDATDSDSSKDAGAYDGSLPLYVLSIVH